MTISSFQEVALSSTCFLSLSLAHTHTHTHKRRYVLDCERLSEAQEEELKSKQKIEDERLKQHEMMLAEVRRAKDQATIDACELAIASALYPVNTPVSMGSYSHGHISEINCDGLYSVSLNGAVRRHVKESDLSPYVEPQYVMYDDTYSRRPTYTQPHRRRRASTTTSNSYSGSYGESSSQHDSGWETTFGIAVLVVIVLFYLLFCKSSRGTHTPRRTAATRSTTTRTTTRNNNPNPPSPHHERANTRRRHGNISNNQYAKLGVAAALNAASMYNSRSTGSTASNNLYRRTSTTSKTKRDVAKEEQIRSTKIKGLAELQKSRVVAKTAELKHNEDARKREYETRMNQSQRNVTNDTQQHGNQMRRTDHVKDRHEAASYAKTKFR